MSVNGEDRDLEQQDDGGISPAGESTLEQGSEDASSARGASSDGARTEGDRLETREVEAGSIGEPEGAPSLSRTPSAVDDESGEVEIDLGLDGEGDDAPEAMREGGTEAETGAVVTGADEMNGAGDAGGADEASGADDAGGADEMNGAVDANSEDRLGGPDWERLVSDLEHRIEELTRELDKTKNQMLRVAADFENYRKRMQRQLPEAEARAGEKVLVEVLPVMDSLTLALEHAQGNGDGASLAEGVELVVKQFAGILAKLGVSPIEALGQPFDPAIHEAMQQEASSDVPPGTVIKEWQRGYQIGDRLLRPSMVVVSSAPAADSQVDASSEEALPESQGPQEDQDDETHADAVTDIVEEGGAKGDGDGDAGPEAPGAQASQASEDSSV